LPADSLAELDAFPNAGYILIKDAAHFPFEEQPEVFAATVEMFLEST